MHSALIKSIIVPNQIIYLNYAKNIVLIYTLIITILSWSRVKDLPIENTNYNPFTSAKV